MGGAPVKYLAALALFALVPDAQCESTFKGYSAYAAMSPKFPCERFLTLSDNARNPAMAVLYRLFGDDISCLSRFTGRYEGQQRHHLVEYHLYYDPARRSLGEAELLQLGSDISDVRAIAERVGNQYTHSVLSIGLEDRLDDKSAAKLLAVARARWPYLIVRNPLKSRNKLSADFRETHGTDSIKPPCFANNDGHNLSKSQLRRFKQAHRGCYATIFWDGAAQGYVNGKRPRGVAPGDRNFVISDEAMRTYGELLQ